MRDTVIFGAGVIGAATAYYLSLRGIQSTVVERRSVASGASGTAAGLLSAPTPWDLREPWGDLAHASLTLHHEVAQTLDGATNYDFAPIETALIACSEAERIHIASAFGEDAWLPADQLAARCPWLTGSEALGGVIRTGSAQLDPARFTATLLEAAGAEVVFAPAEGINAHDGRLTGVTVAGESHSCSTAIVAMGPWSLEAADWLGIPVPVRPLKGQILRMELPDGPAGGFADLDGNYVVRKPNGITYTGTTEEEAGFDETPTPEIEAQILATAARLAPATRGGHVIERTACLRPLSVDNSPIIGAVPGLARAYLATGHGRKGLLMSLATGKALAELIVDGATKTVDLSPFKPGRFGS